MCFVTAFGSTGLRAHPPRMHLANDISFLLHSKKTVDFVSNIEPIETVADSRENVFRKSI